MKIIGKTLTTFAGAMLAVSPVMAAPVERASQSAEEANEMGGGAWLGIIGAALVVALAAIAAFDDNGDNPVSP